MAQDLLEMEEVFPLSLQVNLEEEVDHVRLDNWVEIIAFQNRLDIVQSDQILGNVLGKGVLSP